VRDDQARLLDIQEAIERIESRVPDRRAFESDDMLQVWVVRHLEILGEACRGLSTEFKATHGDYDWSEPIGMRDILIHHYFEIDLDAVWSVIEGDLPVLKRIVEEAL
jgi:uncharacterized protein with HEPN domain